MKIKLLTPIYTHFPTKFSKTELLPALWPPTTAICGKSSCIWTPNCVNASCNLFTIGISASIPWFEAILDTELNDNFGFTFKLWQKCFLCFFLLLFLLVLEKVSNIYKFFLHLIHETTMLHLVMLVSYPLVYFRVIACKRMW